MKTVLLGTLGVMCATSAFAQESGGIIYRTQPAGQITQSPASIRSRTPMVVQPGVIPLNQITPIVDLAPGERVVQIIAAPTMVRAPATQTRPMTITATVPAVTQRVRPAPVVDPLTGRLRDTPGWTGRTDNADGVACFPCN